MHAQEECSIPAGMGKYNTVQAKHGVTGDVLNEIGDKTMLGLILLEIVYNFKKKLGCIFVENHNSKTIILNRGQSIGLVTSCVVTQEEQGQLLVKRKEDTPSVTEQSNDIDTGIGGTSVGNVEKAGRKADSFTKPKEKSINLSGKVFS